MEEAEVELSAEGGKKVAEFFEAIYERLAVIAQEGEDDDDDDEEEDDEEDSEGDEKSASRAGSFEVYMDANGKYRFRMKAANGQTIAVSQAYKKKESCLKGIESVRKNAEAVVKEV
ncbi:MAG: YegP family protein [Lachnospiraceae bacterium]|nr:YegP family protein [Lachnospiraceae bacterium]